MIALALLATLVSLVLGEFSRSQEHLAHNRYRQEVLTLAGMAMQTGQSQLSLNGLDIEIKIGKEDLIIYEGGKEVLRLEKD